MRFIDEEGGDMYRNDYRNFWDSDIFTDPMSEFLEK